MVPLFAFFAIKKGNVMSAFETNEKLTSQLPALQLLIGLGFEFLTPAGTLRERQGRTSNVLLEDILRGQLKEINRIHSSQHRPSRSKGASERGTR